MGFFEGEISKAVVLALFIPLIISSGGNSGSQASSIIIRAMALGEIKFTGLVVCNAKGNFFRHCAGHQSWGLWGLCGYFSGSTFTFTIMENTGSWSR